MSSTRSSKYQSQTNLCLRITGFDLDAPEGGYAKGVVVAPDYKAGLEVAVRLMNDQECLETFRKNRSQKDNAKFFKARPTIANFSDGYTVGRNSIDPMEIGGLVMCHGCTFDQLNSTDKQPVYKAQYIENYGNDPSRAVMYGSGRVTLREYQGEQFAKLDLLELQNAREIKSFGDIQSFYKDFMTGNYDHLYERPVVAENIAALRLISSENRVVARQLYVPTQNIEGVNRDNETVAVRVPVAHDVALAHAFEQGEQSDGFFKLVAAALDKSRLEGLSPEMRSNAELLGRRIESGEMRVEMIPGFKLDIIGKTLEQMLTERKQLNKQFNDALIHREPPEGQEAGPPIPGFARMTVAVAVG